MAMIIIDVSDGTDVIMIMITNGGDGDKDDGDEDGDDAIIHSTKLINASHT